MSQQVPYATLLKIGASSHFVWKDVEIANMGEKVFLCRLDLFRSDLSSHSLEKLIKLAIHHTLVYDIQHTFQSALSGIDWPLPGSLGTLSSSQSSPSIPPS